MPTRPVNIGLGKVECQRPASHLLSCILGTGFHNFDMR